MMQPQPEQEQTEPIQAQLNRQAKEAMKDPNDPTKPVRAKRKTKRKKP